MSCPLVVLSCHLAFRGADAQTVDATETAEVIVIEIGGVDGMNEIDTESGTTEIEIEKGRGTATDLLAVEGEGG